ncbi:MAG: phospho-sugar mutase [Bacteroidales bacterium]
MSADYLERAKTWLSESFDQTTREEVKKLMDENLKELEDAFYKNLEFGTGGLRGIMGTGTNRINRYTIGMATQGLADYLLKSFKERKSLSVAVSYDNRNNSPFFAKVTAEVFAANGFIVYLFESLRPTPELSFTIRNKGCVAGVMITASHNPKEYNGYKAYWEDGAQVTSPHDENIINEVLKIESPSKVKFEGNPDNIKIIGKEADDIYLDAILSLTLSKELVEKNNSLKIVYTPLHGTGVKIVPEALRRAGFKNIYGVPQQEVVDGNFPTVDSPNPEEKGALKMAIEQANLVGAHLVMATDPDADRIGIAVRDRNNELIMLNGNQMASILSYYLLERGVEKGIYNRDSNPGYYMVKTIVTTDLLSSIAGSYGVEMMNVLTGFKYIAEVVRMNEGKRKFIGGGEESYGFNAGEFVRDKDAVIACCLVAEAAVWASERGISLYDLLMEIYLKFGLYKEHLISITKKGKDGLEQISEMMKKFRETPPQNLAGSPVVLVHDYLNSETVDMVSDLRYKIGLPKSNVLQFISSDNSIVSVRPSGTEPKIKFYFGVKAHINTIEEYNEAELSLTKKIDEIAAHIAGY